jgi:hypothetical protein
MHQIELNFDASCQQILGLESEIKFPVRNGSDTTFVAVTHPSTDFAQCCLTSVIEGELVHMASYLHFCEA